MRLGDNSLENDEWRKSITKNIFFNGTKCPLLDFFLL